MKHTDLQEAQYTFPYHHVAHLDAGGHGTIRRTLGWGLEYLCYMHHIAELVRSFEPTGVLDVGCGDGRLLGLLDRVPRRVGVDLSARAIDFANAFHPEIDFRAIDVADLTETFPVVSAIEVLEHVPDDSISGFLRTLAARTEVGGHVVVSVPTTIRPKHPKHHRHYDAPLFHAQLGASEAPLEIVRTDHVFRDSALLTLYKRFSENRLWSFDFHPMRRWIWTYVWNHLRHASASNAAHLAFVMQRVD